MSAPIFLFLFLLGYQILPAQVKFYEVPFSCSVKPGLGCGSSAKPVLLKLANNSEVESAWMNYNGSSIALIWRTNTSKERKRDILKNAFIVWDFIPEEISAEEEKKLEESINLDKGWLKEGQVDELSLEEAEEYADILVEMLTKRNWIQENNVKLLWDDLAEYFRTELVILRDYDDHEKWVKQVKKMMSNYANPENVQTLTIWNMQ